MQDSKIETWQFLKKLVLLDEDVPAEPCFAFAPSVLFEEGKFFCNNENFKLSE